jgi:hypothetical protein
MIGARDYDGVNVRISFWGCHAMELNIYVAILRRKIMRYFCSEVHVTAFELHGRFRSYSK